MWEATVVRPCWYVRKLRAHALGELCLSMNRLERRQNIHDIISLICMTLTRSMFRFNDPPSVLLSQVAMSPPNISLLTLILDKGRPGVWGKWRASFP